MGYLMITSWDNHWDGKLYGRHQNRSHFTKPFLKEGLTVDDLDEGARTLFIKCNIKTKKHEKAWIGKVSGFSIEGNDIWFTVNIESEIPLPQNFSNYGEGWYPVRFQDEEDENTPPQDSLEEILSDSSIPPAFRGLFEEENWKDFELLTYFLLKALGIHDIILIPPEKQSGRSDGFFKFGKLVVLYDATLQENFEGKKMQQISNYTNQLRDNIIEYENHRWHLNGMHKQVWIITRDGEPAVIKQIDDIPVKRVPVTELIKLYRQRLEYNFSGNVFEDYLRKICEYQNI